MPFEPFDAGAFRARRAEIEADVGRRSFHDFYQMAWPVMDPEPFVDGKHTPVT